MTPGRLNIFRIKESRPSLPTELAPIPLPHPRVHNPRMHTPGVLQHSRSVLPSLEECGRGRGH